MNEDQWRDRVPRRNPTRCQAMVVGAKSGELERCKDRVKITLINEDGLHHLCKSHLRRACDPKYYKHPIYRAVLSEKTRKFEVWPGLEPLKAKPLRQRWPIFKN